MIQIKNHDNKYFERDGDEMFNKIKRSIQDIIRPVLSDKTIMKYNKKGLLIASPISPFQLQPNSVDLTLGNTWKKLNQNFVHVKGSDMRNVINPKCKIEYVDGKFTYSNKFGDACVGNGYYILEPGEFVLMASKEVLNIPNGILSFVQGRSSIARLGIQTEQAGLIDAGFRGTITFEVKNQSEYPIMLYEGMRVAQVYFFKAQHAITTYGSKGKGSKYQSQEQPTESRIHMDYELRD